MRLRNTLLLLGVFIILGAYIYLFELNRDIGEKGEKLLDFAEEDVEAIVLIYRDQMIGLNRKPSGKWMLTQPLQAPADEPVIHGILTALNISEVKRIIEERPSKKDLAAFGLDNPWVKLLITLKKEKTLPAILVGEKTPVGYSAYVKRANEAAVLLTSSSLRATMEKELFDFRDKGILRVDPERVTKIELQTEKVSLVLVRSDGGDWRLAAPQNKEVKQAAVSAYLKTLTRLRATGFADNKPESLKKYGLKSPLLKISLEGKASETLGTLLIGENARGELYAKKVGKPTVYIIDRFSYTQVNKTTIDFSAGDKSDSRPPGPAKE